MKRFFLIYLICPLAFAATLDEANALYRQGNYQAAAEAYEEILTEQGPRASVFYNLGNARQQLKQHGPAILAYERAKLLAPRNPDLAANLTLARKAAADFEEPRFHPRVDAAWGYLSRN